MLSGCMGDGLVVKQFTQKGDSVWEYIPSTQARAMPTCLAVLKQDHDNGLHIIHGFTHQHQIKIWNASIQEEIIAYEHPDHEPHKMSWLPPDTMLMLDRSKSPVQIHTMNTAQIPWKHMSTISTGLGFAQSFCNVPTNEGVYVVVTSMDEFCVRAIHLESGSQVWELQGQVDGHLLLPGGVSADMQGHIYIADTTNRRLLVVNIAGHVVQSLLNMPGSISMVRPHGVYVDKRQDKLLIKHMTDGRWVITVFSITQVKM